MNKFNFTKKNKEKNIIGKFFRPYIDFGILICCLIVAFNIHPTNDYINLDKTNENKQMIYIFHDYEGNKYILNDPTHGAANSMDYLFDKNIPNSIKGDDSNYSNFTSLGNDKGQSQEYEGNDSSIKDNQISLENIVTDLGINSDSKIEGKNEYLIINLSDDSKKSEEDLYSVEENTKDSILTIEKLSNQKDNEISDEGFDKNNSKNYQNNDDLPTGKIFTYISDGRIIPILAPREDFKSLKHSNLSYNNKTSNGYTIQGINRGKENGVIIIDDYADCMTPWGYKIVHGDSVLAYKQLDNAPDICNIERRYCRNGKLSGTYTQQGCSINKNYSYKILGQTNIPQKEKDESEFKGGTRENPDGTITVKNNEKGLGFIFDRPNKKSTEFSYEDNFRYEDEGIEQTNRPHRDCSTPRGEKIKHGQVIQAFKHANGFSDAPCETQLRLCSMGELMGTYTESSCESWDTSFIDWINGSPTRKTYSKEKLELVKKKIKNEEKYYKESQKNEIKSINSASLDKILYILDQD